MGAGACLALGTGHGVAFADTDASDNSSSTSQSADKSTDSSTDSDSSYSSRAKDSRAKETDEPADTAPRDDDPTEAGDTDTDTDEAESAEKESYASAAVRKDAKDTKDAEDAEDAEDTENADDTESAPATDTGSDDKTQGPAVTEPVSTPAPTVIETPVPAPAPPESAGTPSSPGPVTTLVLNVLSTLGLSPRPAAVPAVVPGTVTGVQTGHSSLTIPVGTGDYTAKADWYFPTQADGSVSATGVIWLQHGFLSDKSWYSALAQSLSQQTNSIVVAPNVPSFGLFCSGCSLNDAAIQQGAASMFLGDQAALNASATAAGFQGTLPQDFILAGHSAGGGFAAAVAGFYARDPDNERRLRGVVMFDGVARAGVLENALQSLADPYIPIYQIAAPPQAWNAFGATTAALVAGRPGDFVGVTLAGGSHVDALLGANPIIDFFAQLVTRFSPAGNTAAVYTLANGWINDLYQGLGPTDGTGIYGAPDQYIVLGDAAAVVLAPAPLVELDRYLGTWYEVGSVKQFFSIGLVNTTAEYSLNADGSIRVVNSGNYFFDNGPKSTIVGVALPVDATNNKLNVQFFFPASDSPPGNYWIVDLDPDYQWAIVSDSTGLSGFLLSRTPVVSDEFYQQLLNRASVKGVKGWITRTRQPAGERETSSTFTGNSVVI